MATAPAVHACDAQCQAMRRLAHAGWSYTRMAGHLGFALEELRVRATAHSRVGIVPRRMRDGASSCLDCRREVDPRVPPTQLLDADECCLWCARRHDGDLRQVTPFLARLGASEAPAAGAQPSG